ncbi:MAG TPA: ABC transporter ATP-binding protein [Acidimicrobiales bacterium]|jgi:branched-chain amino acid transport system ATP-binding protein|nr:ABC transporter ATP-binding protein [Acidimicrobiales bacterium]
MATLRAQEVTCGYGKLSVLHDIELSISPGEIVALVGPNGAGKTTLLKALSGEMSVVSGKVFLDDKDITGWSVRDRVVAGLAHIPEHRHLFPNLSVRDNLLLGQVATRRKAGARPTDELTAGIVDLFPVLGERMGSAAGTLSGGQQQMLAIGRGLMSEPTMILLDEPSLGLAPGVVERLLDAFRSLAEMGVGILLVEQYVESALAVSSRGYVLRAGRIGLAGASPELLGDRDRLVSAYFGTDSRSAVL